MKIYRVKSKDGFLGYVRAVNKKEAERLVRPYVDTDFKLRRVGRKGI